MHEIIILPQLMIYLLSDRVDKLSIVYLVKSISSWLVCLAQTCLMSDPIRPECGILFSSRTTERTWVIEDELLSSTNISLSQTSRVNKPGQPDFVATKSLDSVRIVADDLKICPFGGLCQPEEQLGWTPQHQLQSCVIWKSVHSEAQFTIQRSTH